MIINFFQNIIRKFKSNTLYSILYSFVYVHGQKDRLCLGKSVSLANTIFNTRSGSIFVDDNSIFGHNVMVLTGYHDIQIRGSKVNDQRQEASRSDP